MTNAFPPTLEPGGTIGVVAPCSAADGDRVRNGISYLEGLGYRVKTAPNLSTKYGFLAGDDKTRISEFNRMWADPDVDAVFCVRGGYGVMRILPYLDYEMMSERPKILLGYSDISAMQMAAAAKCGLVSFSGPMVAADMHEPMDALAEKSLWAVLTGSQTALENPPEQPLGVYRDGEAYGPLYGGTLTVLLPLIGTEYMPDLNGAVLVLEDLDENPGRIDRHLHHLREHGVFDRISGLILGQFTDCFPDDVEPPETIEAILDSALKGCDFPVLTNLAYGHLKRRLTLPLGAKVRLSTSPVRVECI